MPLFQVQDDDRPAYVVARDYVEALQKWDHAIERENGEKIDAPPKGVAFVADDDELILGDVFVKEL